MIEHGEQLIQDALAASANGHHTTHDAGPSAEELVNFSCDDYGNAQAVRYLYGDRIKRTAATGPMFYTGTHWNMELGEAKVNAAILETFRIRGQLAFKMPDIDEGKHKALLKASRLTTHNRNATRAMLLDMVTVENSTLTDQPDLLNVANCVIDLRTGEMLEHDPAYMFQYCVPTLYIPEMVESDEYREWQQFITSCLTPQGAEPNQQIIDAFQMALGYSITGRTNEEKFFYVRGEARSGKGTLFSTQRALLGSPLSSSIDYDSLVRNRNGDQGFDLAPLKDCRLLESSESARHAALNARVVKSLTGRDAVYCAFKGRDYFSYTPKYKIWITSNFGINMDVEDGAAWARPIRFEFPNSWAGREDKSLKDRFQRPEMLEAVLCWLVQGAMRWYASPRGLEEPDELRTLREADRAARDYISLFFDDCGYELDAEQLDVEVESQALYDEYRTWCDECGYPRKNQGQFVSTLKERGFKAGRKWRHQNGRRVQKSVLFGIQRREQGGQQQQA